MLLAGTGHIAGVTLGWMGIVVPGGDQSPLLLPPILGLSLSHLQSCPSALLPSAASSHVLGGPNFPLQLPKSAPPPTHWYHSHASPAPCAPGFLPASSRLSTLPLEKGWSRSKPAAHGDPGQPPRPRGSSLFSLRELCS